MRKPLILSSYLVMVSMTSCLANDNYQPGKENVMIINVMINKQTFEISLTDNLAAKAFAEKLPLTMNMEELNGNEKFAELPYVLPVSKVRPGTINSGDLMLYGTQTLVLFYETFQSSYRYTPIGKVMVASNIKDAVGNKNAEVSFYRK